MAAAYAMTGPAVAQHMNVLEHASLIRRETRRQWRDCVVTPEGLDRENHTQELGPVLGDLNGLAQIQAMDRSLASLNRAVTSKQ